MASYMMLFKFNSAQNAQLFWTNANNQGMQPANVTVPSGWVGPSGPSTGIGQPSSQPSSDNSYVLIYSPTPTTPFPGYRPDLVFDTSTRQPLFVSPNIDPATITIMDGDNSIFYRGLPSQEWQPPPPTPMSDPIEFTPIYPPRDALNEFYKQYLKQVADFPSDPNVMRDAQSDLEPPAEQKAPVEQQDLPPIPIPEPYRNPYDITDPVNFPKIFPEIEPDPDSPVFRNPDTDPTIDPDIVIQPPRDVVPGEFKDLPQQHLYPYQPLKISVEGPSGGGFGVGLASFVIGSKGQQLGPGDLYTSPDGKTWKAQIGVLTVPGASFADGVAGVMAGFGSNFVISASGTGTYGGIVSRETITKISHDGGVSLLDPGLIGFGDGANSPTTGILFNYYDANPVSGKPAFRLALQNFALTQVTYYSSYNGGISFVSEGISKPSFWGARPLNNYATGLYLGKPFYIAPISGQGGDIYGGTTIPGSIATVPSGWTLLFTNSLVLNGPVMGVNLSGQSDTQFVVAGGGNGAPTAATGTGNAATWAGQTLSGSLGIIQGIGSDPSTWEYTL